MESATLEATGSSSRGSGWALSGLASSWECRAAQSRRARPEAAQKPKPATAMKRVVVLPPYRHGRGGGVVGAGGGWGVPSKEGWLFHHAGGRPDAMLDAVEPPFVGARIQRRLSVRQPAWGRQEGGWAGGRRRPAARK